MIILKHRIIMIIVLNSFVMLFGTFGYIVLEQWSLSDSLYMTIITVAGVGFEEVNELTSRGRLFTIVLILIGVATVATTFTLLVELILNEEIQAVWRERRMQRTLDKLENHIIVCGYGRVGSNAVQVLLHEHKREIVVIDNSLDSAETLKHNGVYLLVGDATQDEILHRAGVERAWGLLTVTGDDSVNLFIVLSARSLNPNLTIVARSSRIENESKMIRAGANRVVSPYDIGGKRMAHSLLRPHLTEFLDVLTGDAGVEMWLEELQVREASHFIGKTVAEINMRQRTGVTLLAILRVGRSEVITPTRDTRFEIEDDLIVIGTRQQLDNLEKMVS